MAEARLETIRQLALSLGERLSAASLSVVTAESCTGGWVAKAITDVPGSSAWFEAGLVTYANEAKRHFIGVSEATLERDGAVSAATVAEMARGALAAWPRATLSVAISGVAGPDGGSPGKPVGTVWFAWADRRSDAPPITDCAHFEGDREAVRAAAVGHALAGLLALL